VSLGYIIINLIFVLSEKCKINPLEKILVKEEAPPRIENSTPSVNDKVIS